MARDSCHLHIKTNSKSSRWRAIVAIATVHITERSEEEVEQYEESDDAASAMNGLLFSSEADEDTAAAAVPPARGAKTVSYTHLTLPTICSV